MSLDRDRLAEVLNADYSYYEGPVSKSTIDDRLNPSTSDFISTQLAPDLTVLDLGCGDGSTLLRHADRFAYGVGIYNDQSHLDLAARKASAANVEFLELDMDGLAEQPWEERFDFVFSERGPIGYGVKHLRTALRVLRTDGLIFSEVIGDLHHQEVREVFGGGPRFNQMIRTLDQVTVAMERNGVGIRVAADIVSKRYYPDVYEWLKFQCGIWVWAGGRPPAVDDPRLELFAERARTGEGERIEVTHHVVWVGGVKLENPAAYGE